MRKFGCSRTAFPLMMPRRYGDQWKNDQLRSRPASNYWESHPFDKFNDSAVATQLLANLTEEFEAQGPDASVKWLALTMSDFAGRCANPPNGFVRQELQRHSRRRVRS